MNYHTHWVAHFNFIHSVPKQKRNRVYTERNVKNVVDPFYFAPLGILCNLLGLHGSRDVEEFFYCKCVLR